MSLATYTNLLKVVVGGRELTPVLGGMLTEGWVDAGVNVPAAFQLTFRDPHRDVLPDLGVKLGDEVELSVRSVAEERGPLLTGEVTALEADFDATGKYTVVRGHDLGHRLLRNRRVKAYVGMTASEIARDLAARNRLRIGKVGKKGKETIYDQITQPNVTDWEFLTRLARENDLEMYFTGRGEFCFHDPAPASGAPGGTAEQSPRVLEFNQNLLRCRTGVTAADQVRDVEVRGWDVKTKRALTARTKATDSPELKIGVTGVDATRPWPGEPLTATGVPYETQSQVEGAARALAADVASALAEVEAEVSGDSELRPGLPVVITGMGRPFDGKYTVTSTRHLFATDDRYVTWVTVTGRQHRSLYGLASGAASTEPRLPGVAVAIVTEVGRRDRQGLVRLRFPWLDDKYVSDWARVAQFGGTAGGGLIMPEVDDEVLVAFDRGMLDHPYVLAGLYNGVDKPPKYQKAPVVGGDGKVDWRSVASRTGHRMELADLPSQKGVLLSTGDGNLTIDMNQVGSTITVRSDGTVKIVGSRRVAVNGADISVNAAGGLSLRAGGNLSLSAGGSVNVQAGAAMAFTAGPTLVLKAAASIRATSVNVDLMGIVKANGKPVI